MRGGLSVWADLVRSVGRALFELLGAEYAALSDDIRGTAGRLARAAALCLAAVFVAFWTLGLAVYAAVELTALALPRWGAALAVLGGLTLVVLILALVARGRLRRLEPPTATVRRHLADHLAWWRRRVLEEGEAEVDLDREAS